jgi:hypothetical protein
MFSHGFEPSGRRQHRVFIQRDFDYRFGTPQARSSAIPYDTVWDVFHRNPCVQFGEKGTVRNIHRFCVLGSSIEKFEGDLDFPIFSSGVKNIRTPLSCLGVLYTGLPESPRQFSRFPLQDRFFAVASVKERSESSVRGTFPLSFTFLPAIRLGWATSFVAETFSREHTKLWTLFPRMLRMRISYFNTRKY